MDYSTNFVEISLTNKWYHDFSIFKMAAIGFLKIQIFSEQSGWGGPIQNDTPNFISQMYCI